MCFDLDSGPHCLSHGTVFGGGPYDFVIKAHSKPTVTFNKPRGSFKTMCALIWVLEPIVFTTAPFLVGGRTILRLRLTARALGFKVNFRGPFKAMCALVRLLDPFVFMMVPF